MPSNSHHLHHRSRSEESISSDSLRSSGCEEQFLDLPDSITIDTTAITNNTLPTVSQSSIQRMRAMFEQELTRNGTTAYHPIDIERVRTQRWQCERYLRYHVTTNNNDSNTNANDAVDNDDDDDSVAIQQAFEQMITTLKWKKEIALHDRKDEDFPREFYQINGIEVLGRVEIHNVNNSSSSTTTIGPLLVWNTSRYTREFGTHIRIWIKRFIEHEIEHFDQIAGSGGMIIVCDCKHSGLLSIDLDISRYVNELIQKHYPGIVRLAILFNLSYILYPILRVILSFVPPTLRSTLRLVSSDSELRQLLGSHLVPIEYGGERDNGGGGHGSALLRCPTNAKSYTELESLIRGLPDEELRRCESLLQRQLNR